MLWTICVILLILWLLGLLRGYTAGGLISCSAGYRLRGGIGQSHKGTQTDVAVCTDKTSQKRRLNA